MPRPTWNRELHIGWVLDGLQGVLDRGPLWIDVHRCLVLVLLGVPPSGMAELPNILGTVVIVHPRRGTVVERVLELGVQQINTLGNLSNGNIGRVEYFVGFEGVEGVVPLAGGVLLTDEDDLRFFCRHACVVFDGDEFERVLTTGQFLHV